MISGDKYLESFYQQMGGANMFGSDLNTFSSKMKVDPMFRKQVYDNLGGESQFGHYDKFNTVVTSAPQVLPQDLGKGNQKSVPVYDPHETMQIGTTTQAQRDSMANVPDGLDQNDPESHPDTKTAGTIGLLNEAKGYYERIKPTDQSDKGTFHALWNWATGIPSAIGQIGKIAGEFASNPLGTITKAIVGGTNVIAPIISPDVFKDQKEAQLRQREVINQSILTSPEAQDPNSKLSQMIKDPESAVHRLMYEEPAYTSKLIYAFGDMLSAGLMGEMVHTATIPGLEDIKDQKVLTALYDLNDASTSRAEGWYGKIGLSVASMAGLGLQMNSAIGGIGKGTNAAKFLPNTRLVESIGDLKPFERLATTAEKTKILTDASLLTPEVEQTSTLGRLLQPMGDVPTTTTDLTLGQKIGKVAIKLNEDGSFGGVSRMELSGKMDRNLLRLKGANELGIKSVEATLPYSINTTNTEIEKMQQDGEDASPYYYLSSLAMKNYRNYMFGVSTKVGGDVSDVFNRGLNSVIKNATARTVVSQLTGHPLGMVTQMRLMDAVETYLPRLFAGQTVETWDNLKTKFVDEYISFLPMGAIAAQKELRNNFIMSKYLSDQKEVKTQADQDAAQVKQQLLQKMTDGLDNILDTSKMSPEDLKDYNDLVSRKTDDLLHIMASPEVASHMATQILGEYNKQSSDALKSEKLNQQKVKSTVEDLKDEDLFNSNEILANHLDNIEGNIRGIGVTVNPVDGHRGYNFEVGGNYHEASLRNGMMISDLQDMMDNGQIDIHEGSRIMDKLQQFDEDLDHSIKETMPDINQLNLNEVKGLKSKPIPKSVEGRNNFIIANSPGVAEGIRTKAEINYKSELLDDMLKQSPEAVYGESYKTNQIVADKKVNTNIQRIRDMYKPVRDFLGNKDQFDQFLKTKVESKQPITVGELKDMIPVSPNGTEKDVERLKLAIHNYNTSLNERPSETLLGHLQRKNPGVPDKFKGDMETQRLFDILDKSKGEVDQATVINKLREKGLSVEEIANTKPKVMEPVFSKLKMEITREKTKEAIEKALPEYDPKSNKNPDSIFSTRAEYGFEFDNEAEKNKPVQLGTNDGWHYTIKPKEGQSEFLANTLKKVGLENRMRFNEDGSISINFGHVKNLNQGVRKLNESFGQFFDKGKNKFEYTNAEGKSKAVKDKLLKSVGEYYDGKEFIKPLEAKETTTKFKDLQKKLYDSGYTELGKKVTWILKNPTDPKNTDEMKRSVITSAESKLNNVSSEEFIPTQKSNDDLKIEKRDPVYLTNKRIEMNQDAEMFINKFDVSSDEVLAMKEGKFDADMGRAYRNLSVEARNKVKELLAGSESEVFNLSKLQQFDKIFSNVKAVSTNNVNDLINEAKTFADGVKTKVNEPAKKTTTIKTKVPVSKGQEDLMKNIQALLAGAAKISKQLPVFKQLGSLDGEGTPIKEYFKQYFGVKYDGIIFNFGDFLDARNIKDKNLNTLRFSGIVDVIKERLSDMPMVILSEQKMRENEILVNGEVPTGGVFLDKDQIPKSIREQLKSNHDNIDKGMIVFNENLKITSDRDVTIRVLHEQIHGLTSEVLRTDDQMRNELQDIINTAKDHIEKNKIEIDKYTEYALSSPDELLSMVFSDGSAELYKILGDVKVKEVGFKAAILDWIRRAVSTIKGNLGIEEQKTLLDEVARVMSNVIDVNSDTKASPDKTNLIPENPSLTVEQIFPKEDPYTTEYDNIPEANTNLSMKDRISNELWRRISNDEVTFENVQKLIQHPDGKSVIDVVLKTIPTIKEDLKRISATSAFDLYDKFSRTDTPLFFIDGKDTIYIKTKEPTDIQTITYKLLKYLSAKQESVKIKSDAQKIQKGNIDKSVSDFIENDFGNIKTMTDDIIAYSDELDKYLNTDNQETLTENYLQTKVLGNTLAHMWKDISLQNLTNTIQKLPFDKFSDFFSPVSENGKRVDDLLKKVYDEKYNGKLDYEKWKELSLKKIYNSQKGKESKKNINVVYTKVDRDNIGQVSLVENLGSTFKNPDGTTVNASEESTLLESSYMKAVSQVLKLKNMELTYVNQFIDKRTAYKGDKLSKSAFADKYTSLIRPLWDKGYVFVGSYSDKSEVPVYKVDTKDPMFLSQIEKLYDAYTNAYQTMGGQLKKVTDLPTKASIVMGILFHEAKYGSDLKSIAAGQIDAKTSAVIPELTKPGGIFKVLKRVHYMLKKQYVETDSLIDPYGISDKVSESKVNGVFYKNQFDESGRLLSRDLNFNHVTVKTSSLDGTEQIKLYTNKYGESIPEGISVNLKDYLFNKYGVDITDGLSVALLGKGQFMDMYWDAHGDTKHGTVKQWAGNEAGEVPYYLKHALHGVEPNSPIGKWMTEHNIAVLSFEQANKLAKPDQCITLSDLQNGTINEDLIRELPFKQMQNIMVKGGIKSEVKALKQIITSTSLFKANSFLHDGPKIVDHLSTILKNNYDNKITSLGKLSSDYAEAFSTIQDVMNSPQGIRESAFGETMGFMKDMKLQDFIDNYSNIVRHPAIAKIMEKKIMDKMQDIFNVSLPEGSTVTLGADLGLFAPERIKYVSSNIHRMIEGDTEFLSKHFTPEQISRHNDIKDFVSELRNTKKEYQQNMRKGDEDAAYENLKDIDDLNSTLRRLSTDEKSDLGDSFRKVLTSKEGYQEYKKSKIDDILDDKGMLKQGYCYITKDFADEKGYKVGDKLVHSMVPSDSLFALDTSIIAGILPESASENSKIYLNSDYAQGILGRDFDIDVMFAFGQTNGMSGKAWKEMTDEIGLNRKTLNEAVSRSANKVLKTKEFSTDSTLLSRMFKELGIPDTQEIDDKLALNKTLQKYVMIALNGEKSTKFNPFDLTNFQALQSYFPNIGEEISNRAYFTTACAVGLKSDFSIEFPIGDKNVPFRFKVDPLGPGNEISQYKHQIITNDRVDSPNRENIFYYRYDEALDFIQDYMGYKEAQSYKEYLDLLEKPGKQSKELANNPWKTKVELVKMIKEVNEALFSGALELYKDQDVGGNQQTFGNRFETLVQQKSIIEMLKDPSRSDELKQMLTEIIMNKRTYYDNSTKEYVNSDERNQIIETFLKPVMDAYVEGIYKNKVDPNSSPALDLIDRFDTGKLADFGIDHADYGKVERTILEEMMSNFPEAYDKTKGRNLLAEDYMEKGGVYNVLAERDSKLLKEGAYDSSPWKEIVDNIKKIGITTKDEMKQNGKWSTLVSKLKDLPISLRNIRRTIDTLYNFQSDTELNSNTDTEYSVARSNSVRYILKEVLNNDFIYFTKATQRRLAEGNNTEVSLDQKITANKEPVIIRAKDNGQLEFEYEGQKFTHQQIVGRQDIAQDQTAKLNELRYLLFGMTKNVFQSLDNRKKLNRLFEFLKHDAVPENVSRIQRVSAAKAYLKDALKYHNDDSKQMLLTSLLGVYPTDKVVKAVKSGNKEELPNFNLIVPTAIGNKYEKGFERKVKRNDVNYDYNSYLLEIAKDVHPQFVKDYFDHWQRIAGVNGLVGPAERTVKEPEDMTDAVKRMYEMPAEIFPASDNKLINAQRFLDFYNSKYNKDLFNMWKFPAYISFMKNLMSSPENAYEMLKKLTADVTLHHAMSVGNLEGTNELTRDLRSMSYDQFINHFSKVNTQFDMANFLNVQMKHYNIRKVDDKFVADHLKGKMLGIFGDLMSIRNSIIKEDNGHSFVNKIFNKYQANMEWFGIAHEKKVMGLNGKNEMLGYIPELLGNKTGSMLTTSDVTAYNSESPGQTKAEPFGAITLYRTRWAKIVQEMNNFDFKISNDLSMIASQETSAKSAAKDPWLNQQIGDFNTTWKKDVWDMREKNPFNIKVVDKLNDGTIIVSYQGREYKVGKKGVGEDILNHLYQSSDNLLEESMNGHKRRILESALHYAALYDITYPKAMDNMRSHLLMTKEYLLQNGNLPAALDISKRIMSLTEYQQDMKAHKNYMPHSYPTTVFKDSYSEQQFDSFFNRYKRVRDDKQFVEDNPIYKKSHMQLQGLDDVELAKKVRLVIDGQLSNIKTDGLGSTFNPNFISRKLPDDFEGYIKNSYRPHNDYSNNFKTMLLKDLSAAEYAMFSVKAKQNGENAFTQDVVRRWYAAIGDNRELSTLKKNKSSIKPGHEIEFFVQKRDSKGEVVQHTIWGKVSKVDDENVTLKDGFTEKTYALKDIYTRNYDGSIANGKIERYSRAGAVEYLNQVGREMDEKDRNVIGKNLAKYAGITLGKTFRTINSALTLTNLGTIGQGAAAMINLLGGTIINMEGSPLKNLGMIMEGYKNPEAHFAELPYNWDEIMSKLGINNPKFMLDMASFGDLNLTTLGVDASLASTVKLLMGETMRRSAERMNKSLGIPLKLGAEGNYRVEVNDLVDQYKASNDPEQRVELRHKIYEATQKLNKSRFDSELIDYDSAKENEAAIKKVFENNTQLPIDHETLYKATVPENLKLIIKTSYEKFNQSNLGMKIFMKPEPFMRKSAFFVGYYRALELGYDQQTAIEYGFASVTNKQKMYGPSEKQFMSNTTIGSFLNKFSHFAWSELIRERKNIHEAVKQMAVYTGLNPLKLMANDINETISYYDNGKLVSKKHTVDTNNVKSYMVATAISMVLSNMATIVSGIDNPLSPIKQFQYNLAKFILDFCNERQNFVDRYKQGKLGYEDVAFMRQVLSSFGFGYGMSMPGNFVSYDKTQNAKFPLLPRAYSTGKKIFDAVNAPSYQRGDKIGAAIEKSATGLGLVTPSYSSEPELKNKDIVDKAKYMYRHALPSVKNPSALPLSKEVLNFIKGTKYNAM